MARRGGGGPAEDARTLVVAAEELPLTYDPDDFLPSHPAEDSDIAIQLFDRLLTYGDAGADGGVSQDLDRLRGELAGSWEVQDGGRRHLLRLRPVRSQHGHTLSAEDVVWSWHRGIERRQVGRWVAFMGSVPRRWRPGCEVRALDGSTVEFTLEKPNALFPHLLTMQVPPIIDHRAAEAHATESDPTSGAWLRENAAGYGPYAVERRDGRELVLAARDDRGAAPPPLGRVVYRLLPPGRDRVDALVAGEVDLIFEPTADEQRRLAPASGSGGPVELFRARGNAHVALQMDARRAPFDDIEVRRALALAVPYGEIVEEVYGAAARPWRGVVPDTHNGYVEAVEIAEDPEAARAALARAGRRQLSAELYCDAGAPDLVQVSERVAAGAARAGIELDVRPLPTGDFKSRQVAFEMPLAVDRDGHRCNEIGYGLPHDFGDRRHGITNWVQYHNAEVDELIERAEEEQGPSRLALFERAQRLIAADVPWAFLAQPYFCVAHRRGLRGLSWHSRLGGHPRYADLSWGNGAA